MDFKLFLFRYYKIFPGLSNAIHVSIAFTVSNYASSEMRQRQHMITKSKGDEETRQNTSPRGFSCLMNDDQILTNQANNNLRTCFPVIATVFLVVAFAISNLLVELSLSVYDPATSVEKTGTVRNESRNKSSASQTIEGIRIVSMNIAGAIPSKSAPPTWNVSLQESSLTSSIIASDPHIIFLQECPTETWADGRFNRNGIAYKRPVRSKRSHAGYVTMLVQENLVAADKQGLDDLPIAAATLTWKGHQIIIASVHLEPFEQGSQLRKRQVELLLHETDPNADAIIFAGDTNMRDSEDYDIESLGLLDAWKVAGASEETRFSWDTVAHGTGNEKRQNLYYGQSTRAYQRRYDRVYFWKRDKTLGLRVPSFELMANEPVSGSPYHYLSDHFGISCELDILFESR